MIAGLLLMVGGAANAGTIDPNSRLLDDAGATMIEGWLGQGDLDWTSVWYGEAGATAASWHSTVDTLTHTVSIYRATNALNQEVLIGGYTTQSWSGNTIYKTDNDAFIFNLTQPELQEIVTPQYAIYPIPSYFANFGGGIDISGGAIFIGNPQSDNTDGSLRQYSYGTNQGTIDVGNGDNNAYNYSPNFKVRALETFTFVTAAPAPEPEPEVVVKTGPRPEILSEATDISTENTLRYR